MNKHLATAITIDIHVANAGQATSMSSHVAALVKQAYSLDKRAAAEQVNGPAPSNSAVRGLTMLIERLAGYGVDVEAMGVTIKAA